jgi:hypothetical protein
MVRSSHSALLLRPKREGLLRPHAGAAAEAVSNHGARQMDNALSTVKVLPEIARAVAGRVT